MKVSVEEIAGRECTVIRKPFDAEWVKEQLAMGVPVLVDKGAGMGGISNGVAWEKRYSICEPNDFKLFSGVYARHEGSTFGYTITILPPLPRHPTEKDAPLLYRYMAEGIIPMAMRDGNPDSFETATFWMHYAHTTRIKITHATMDGKRVEIAITNPADGEQSE